MSIVEVDASRDDLTRSFKGTGVEVGVADGDYAEVILKNPMVDKLYGVDVYVQHKGYSDYTRGTTFNNMRKHAEALLKPYFRRHEFIYKFSMDAVNQFKDNSLDFVYIDANHAYNNVLEDITEWSNKVKSGGIVAGDDYLIVSGRKGRYEVIQAVNDYCTSHNIFQLFIYKSGDRPPSWVFYK